AVLEGEVVGAPMLDRDAGGAQPGGAVVGERGFPAVVPAEAVQGRVRTRECHPKLLRPCERETGGRPLRGTSGDGARGGGASGAGLLHGLPHRRHLLCRLGTRRFYRATLASPAAR